MKGKLQEWALVAEILSAFAVVASLVFVGLQIQQQSEETALNTRAIELSAYQDLISQIGEINTLLIENKEFSDMWFSHYSGNEYEDIKDQARANSYVNLIVRHGDLAFRQFQSGLIEEFDLISTLRPLTANYSGSPHFKRRWEGLKPGLNPEFIDYIEAIIENE
jgi:hypothetical protein